MSLGLNGAEAGIPHGHKWRVLFLIMWLSRTPGVQLDILLFACSVPRVSGVFVRNNGWEGGWRCAAQQF